MRSLFKYTRESQKFFPSTMLAPLVTHNSSATDVQMEFIVDIQCQVKILRFEEYFIQEIYNDKWRHLCWNIYSSTYVE